MLPPEIADYLSWFCLITGSVFSLIGAVGMLRMPDVFTRIHAASLIETMGVGMILLGLGIQSGFTLIAVKLFMIFAFLFFTNPTTTHALTRALYHAGVIPLSRNEIGEMNDRPAVPTNGPETAKESPSSTT